MRILGLGVLVWLIALPAWANWTFLDAWIDPINDFEVRAATSISDTEIALHLYRYPSGRVYALFTLPEGSPDFATTGIVGKVTPNGFDTREIEVREEPGRFVEYGLSAGRNLRARLWHGQGEAPTIGTLLNILNAQTLHGSFQLEGGETVEGIWSLEGAGLPLAQALGIKIEGVDAGAEWEGAASRSLMAAMTACQFPKLDVLCVQKVTTCSTKISEDRDIDGFEACVSDTNSKD